jgi:hypothetical protein
VEPDSAREYRPGRAIGVILGSVMIAAAVLMVWVGTILTPDDVSTIDGLEGLLFRYVPVGPFTWIGGAVFSGLGLRIALKAIRAETTLRLSPAGVTLPSGAEVEWHQIAEAQASRKDDVLTLEVDLPAGRKSVRLSAFDLGDSPRAVVEEIARRRRALGEATG